MTQTQTKQFRELHDLRGTLDDLYVLHRALSELVVRLVREELAGEDRDKFLEFAREADRRKLLGYYLTRQQRMVDEGTDPVSAYNWAYCDVLNFEA